MRNYIVFNGVSSAEFGLFVGGQESFNAPKKKVTKVSVPGRNGDLIIDQGAFENISVAYNIVGMDGFQKNIEKIKEWLLSPNSYARLEDSYDPCTYRMGIVSAGINFTLYRLNQTGKARITFDCKPQKYLVGGTLQNKIESGDSLYNPTSFKSSPLIHVNGYGTLTIGDENIEIADDYQEIYIDSDIMDCYSGSSNANSSVTFQSNEFPKLAPGDNNITFDNTISEVFITPRWWTL